VKKHSGLVKTKTTTAVSAASSESIGSVSNGLHVGEIMHIIVAGNCWSNHHRLPFKQCSFC